MPFMNVSRPTATVKSHSSAAVVMWQANSSATCNVPSRSFVFVMSEVNGWNWLQGLGKERFATYVFLKGVCVDGLQSRLLCQ